MKEKMVRSVYDAGIAGTEHLRGDGVFDRITGLGYMYEVFADSRVADHDGVRRKEMKKWCEENKTPAIETSLYFHFLNGEDAMAFKLRWL